ncbi:hypothetical protein BC628DRAFT_729299 [Trametes gibbosa]|nr:hypothetical protein BC628DRAFT_729299 [Trametes gibbosa]
MIRFRVGYRSSILLSALSLVFVAQCSHRLDLCTSTSLRYCVCVQISAGIESISIRYTLCCWLSQEARVQVVHRMSELCASATNVGHVAIT